MGCVHLLYEKGGDIPPIVIDVEADDAMAEDDGETSIDVIDILESEGIVLDDDDDTDQGCADDESHE